MRTRDTILLEATKITEGGGGEVTLGEAVQVELLLDIRDLLAEQMDFMLDAPVDEEEDELAPKTCSRCVALLH